VDGGGDTASAVMRRGWDDKKLIKVRAST